MSPKRFVELLAREHVSAETQNPYAFNRSRANMARRHNLLCYLKMMQQLGLGCLLVGEALGYRGGGVTGIPFVSEQILLTHPRYADAAFFPVRHLIKREASLTEASATILHEVCDRLALQALHWNAFPFHPHKPHAPLSNRKPSTAEVMQGGRFVQRLVAMFQPRLIVAVGNSAEIALTKLQIPHSKVRHPSHGGKQAFQAGLAKLVHCA